MRRLTYRVFGIKSPLTSYLQVCAILSLAFGAMVFVASIVAENLLPGYTPTLLTLTYANLLFMGVVAVLAGIEYYLFFYSYIGAD